MRRSSLRRNPGVEVECPAPQRVLHESKSVGGTNVKTGDTRYRGRIAKSERPRDEHLEVLADHITGGREW